MLESLHVLLLCLLAACTLLYLVQVWWFAGGLGRVRPAPPAANEPRVLVVVAARNEAACIGDCVRDLLAQDWPSERYEVVVVDDGSTDGTAEVARGAGGTRVTVVQGAPPGRPGSKKAALTAGIAHGRGELILTTDADCRVPPGWIGGLVGHCTESVGLVAGSSQLGAPGAARGAREGYEAVDFLCLMGCIAGSIGRGHAMAASGQSLAYRRAAFEAVGGYTRVAHRASGDDVLLLQLVRRHTAWGVAFAGDVGARVVHPFSGSWRGLLQQRTRWASNAPVQLRYDPLFFAFMVGTFTLSLLLVASPVLVGVGACPAGWPAAALGAKATAEYAFFRRAAACFQRAELGRWFALYALLQPLHVVVAGVAGCLGIYSWKGQRHRWGVRRDETERGAGR